MSPGGSGYFTCTQNLKLITTKFKSGGLHEKHVVATWSLGKHLSVCLNHLSICLILPHRIELACCAFGEHRAVNRCAACICQRTVHCPTQPSFNLHTLQSIPAEAGHFQSQHSGLSSLSGATVERVCASFQRGLQKSALRCAFLYNCVENALYTDVFASVLPSTEQTLSFVTAFIKLVSYNDSGVKLLQDGSFGRKFVTVYLSTAAYIKF